ncbi:hypothetical protein PV04_03036 [Phialophora macrospora]|uniref:NmrA-like domain-containing protein n=1 Tax=Phialophora macrospora TaxID=1851006 RepID=A0A0D2CZW0_9EURO|nr:hypothetical protein PV04_03036 [Phialophora macrospora]
MTYSILLLGVTTSLGHKVVRSLALRAQDFGRIAILTDGDTENEARAASNGLECIAGSLTDPNSYRGFDVVLSMVEDDVCAAQKEYIDAAIGGCVKHFYPAEYGADLTHALVRDEPYFADKVSVRKYLEARAQADNSLGYTYMMTGVEADLLLKANLLGLSQDKKSATCLGHPDAKVSTTYSDDVAQVIVRSLLPQHLPSLSVRRHVRFTGSAMPTSALYDAISYVLHHPIDVTYLTLDSSHNHESKKSHGSLQPKIAAYRRSLGFGGFEIKEPDEDQLPGRDVVCSGKEYLKELRPRCWAEVVHEYFTRGGNETTTTTAWN